MIAYIKGEITEIMLNAVIIETKSGIGYRVFSDTFSINTVKTGDNVVFYTKQIIREDEHILFGFKNSQSKEIFEKLISVNGVGPKVALSILSAIPSDKIIESVISSDFAAFEAVPGIGKKTAQRLILELHNKFSADSLIIPGTESTDNIIDDAASALIGLGYQRNEALKALSEVRKLGDSAEDLVLLALKRLGR